jgi:hypothetical protein
VSSVRLIWECPNVSMTIGVDALHQQERGAGVTQIVDSDDREIRVAQESVECSADVALIQRRAECGRKDQP